MEKIKGVGICGSPRKNGNSATIMKYILDGVKKAGGESKIIYLNDFLFKGCQACKICAKNGKCIIEDTLTPVFDTLFEAKIWVLASPIYYDSISGQMKLFFDRCRWLTWVDGEMKPRLKGKRRAVIIVTYGDKRERKEYFHEGEKLAYYLSWMGDFGEVKIISEGGLMDEKDIYSKPHVLKYAEEIGYKLAKELI